MKFLVAPKPSLTLLGYHFFGWLVLAGINIATRKILGLEPVSQLIYGAITILLVNSVCCFIFREIIHRNEWQLKKPSKTWWMLFIVSIILGLLSSMAMVALLGFYFIWFSKISIFVFFWKDVYLNWFLMMAMMFLWAMVYCSVLYIQLLSQINQKKQDLAIQLKEAQLNTLNGQLNPHFLFNSLNNIRGLILEDQTKSRKMITALSELLRYSLLSNKKMLSPLSEELDVVNDYLDIASIQYEERLNYEQQLDLDIESTFIPPMLIQMLIENAVKHGISKNKNGGTIKLYGYSEKDNFHMIVTNPGQLVESNTSETGLGLDNIRQRLNLLYGTKASLCIKQEQENVSVTVIFPHEYKGEL